MIYGNKIFKYVIFRYKNVSIFGGINFGVLMGIFKLELFHPEVSIR
jgi:hypothetical protein